MWINIRSLNANFTSLQLFVESMEASPSVIVCTETWNFDYLPFSKFPGYKMYYNDSRVNQNDGIVIYFKDYITEETEIFEIGEVRIMHSSVTMGDNVELDISSIYRCITFIRDIKKCLLKKSIQRIIYYLVIPI